MKVATTEIAARINASIKPLNTERTQPEPQSEGFFESVRVSLSAFGQSKTTTDKANKEIDQSQLPGDVKLILKMIRELKQKIAELMAKLSETMADSALSTEERELVVDSIQMEISTLQAALTDANAALLDALQRSGLPEAQIAQAMSLAV